MMLNGVQEHTSHDQYQFHSENETLNDNILVDEPDATLCWGPYYLILNKPGRD